MTQKEVKNKTKIYTIAAVLSALILVGTIYTVTTPAIMYGTLGISPMKHFNSIDELRNYITTNTIVPEYYYTAEVTGDTGEFWARPSVPDSTSVPKAVPSPAPIATSVSITGTGYATFTMSYSGTNIQVAGVDEADVVKTDGKYIYALTYNSGNVIQIVNADPKNPMVVGRIGFDYPEYVFGMYLSENGNKLAVLGSHSTFYPVLYPIIDDVDPDTSETIPMPTAVPSIMHYEPQTFIYVYDVSNKANPVLTRNVTLSGSYVNSRMVDNYVYLAVNQDANVYDDIVILPRVSTDGVTKDVAPTSIYYTDIQDYSFSYTIFNSVNIMNDAEQPTSLTILMGASSCMYSSTSNMYLTFNKFESTELYRIAFNGANLNFKAQGTVPGYVLNQYSMDEYNNYFRIATTVTTGSWDSRVEYNNLYVLNMNLDTVGKIENLADGERIYSARFAGDKAYLVTFEQVDPFFVLDLKSPTAPKVAGELKIPGFSNYLHPYNENHVIGLGREGDAVKLSLFDVTDMSNPLEVAKYIINENDAWLYSDACYEPKAFLFDQQKQLLVIPITINHRGYWEIEPMPILPIEQTPPPPIMPEDNSGNSSTTADDDIAKYGLWRAGDFWSGVYVFNVSPENGFTLQTALSHKPAGTNNNWWSSVTRSLYIDNVLYTISEDMIQLNSLDDFNLIAQVIF